MALYDIDDSDDDLTLNTLVEGLTESPINPQSETKAVSLLTQLAVYQEFQFIRDEIENFASSLPAGQTVAITLANYPYFTETRLTAVTVHASGSVSVAGIGKGNRPVRVVERLERLSFALSPMTATQQDWRRVEIRFSNR